MKGIFKKRKKILAIDIGSNSIKAVELVAKNKTIQLNTVDVYNLPPDAIVNSVIVNSTIVEEGIRKILERKKIKTKEVIIGLSGRAIIVKIIKLLKRSYEELQKTILWEVEQYIPFNINEVIVDFQILPEVEDSTTKEMEILLVVVKKEKVKKHIEVFHQVGLHPTIVDLDSFAIVNLYLYGLSNMAEETKGGVCLVNIGASFTNINILENGVLYLSRDVLIGGYEFTKFLQNELNLEYLEAEEKKKKLEITQINPSITDEIVMEIKRSFDYYKSTIKEIEINKVFLSGGCSNIKGFDTYVTEKLGTSTTVINPLSKIEIGKRVNFETLTKVSSPSDLTVAIGLALRGVM